MVLERRKIIRNLFRNIKYGIENLILWFPIIWRDRNWDHVYIYDIFRHKLDLMEKNIRKYGNHVDAEKDSDKIKICVNLLDRLLKDKYHNNAYKDYYKKWGETQIEWGDENKSGSSLVKITHPNVKTDKDKKEERKHYKRCMDHEQYLKEQDLDLLFKTMRKHIQKWWD